MPPTTKNGTVHDDSLKIDASEGWPVRTAVNGTHAILATGTVEWDYVHVDWSSTPVTPAASSHTTASFSSGQFSGWWYPTGRRGVPCRD